MTDKNQEQLIGRIRSALDRSLDNLDPAVQLRLDGIRRTVLQHGEIAVTPHRPLLDDEHGALATAIVARLDDSNAELDAAIATRLDQARKISLAAASEPKSPNVAGRSSLRTWFAGFAGHSRFSVPASAFAGLCVLVSAVTLVTLAPQQQSSQELADADILLFASSEDIELYDNLEFYLWLADNGLPN